jgi:hypothetical protein
MLGATRATEGLHFGDLFQVADPETACDTRRVGSVILRPWFDGAREARQAMEDPATGVLRDTKFSPERSSTSVASKLVERETLNEPSLEKATSDYRTTRGTSTGLTVLASSPRDVGINGARW